MPTPASRRSPTSTSGRPRWRLGSRLLRARGARVSCLGDLLLERWAGPTIGITGTAGKTTTTAAHRSILRHAGIDIAVSKGARAGNLWPTADLLERLTDSGAGGETTLLLELTSSHLAFMRSSPTLAAVISFWPDHLELHGSLDRYRAAKEQIVRRQRPGDRVVVNADDARPASRTRTPARPWEISLVRRVERGAFLDEERGVVVTDGTTQTALGHIEAATAHPSQRSSRRQRSRRRQAQLQRRSGRVSTGPSHRPGARNRPERSAALPVVDDGMAATPTKAAATLARYPASSVVLIAGGLTDAGGGSVHATPAEIALLEQACDVIARVARVVVLFGEAAPRLAALLERRHVELIEDGRPRRGGHRGRSANRRRDRGGVLTTLPRHARRPQRSSATSFAAPARDRSTGLRLVDRGGSSRRSSKYGFTYFFNSQNPSTAKNRRLNIVGPPRFAETDCPTDPSE